MDANTVSEAKESEDKERFSESLGKGIPIEGGKRSVFGFGLSGEQEDELYNYLTNKTATRPPGYEPDRDALAECWGVPTPPPEATREKVVGGEDGVDVASTESLYDGEGGGMDLGAKSAEEEDEDEEEPNSELADRLRIVQKVKECYGAGVKTSLERVMRKAHGAADAKPGGVLAPAAQGSLNSNKGKIKEEEETTDSSTLEEEENNEEKSPMMSPEHIMVSNSDPSFQNLWEDECIRYLEHAPEFRARLHYEVRVILISPAFHMAGRTVSQFARVYEKKFGKTIDSIGFSTGARLCRSMPHVVQRALLIDEGKLRLVDTPKNHRIVAGIRSGLRRIIYNVLKTHQGEDIETIEGLLERVTGKSLEEILTDHGYQTPSIECLLRDVPDLVYLEERPERTRVFLCNGAEDPALTDGLLIQGPSLEECTSPQEKSKSGGGFYSEMLEEGKMEGRRKVSEGPRSGPNGMAPEELSDLRVLCAAESSSPYTDASIYTLEDVSPHVRLRFRVLLAVQNDGHGVKVENLSMAYEKMFSAPLDLSDLGFETIKEVLDAWKDDVVKESDGWVFPVNTLENNRILNTITSGLRSAVFAILLARYPEGLEPLELVECLEEALHGKLWEILKSNGYIFKNISKAGEALSKGPADFKLAECSELRLLLQDMDDFVRLGCRDDGALIVKLRDGEFPLLDLLDCEVSEDTNATTRKLMIDSKDLLVDSKDGTDSKMKDEVLDGNTENEGLAALVKRPNKEEIPAASPSTPPATVDTSKRAGFPSQNLMHEIRMIFGSSEYMENGLTVEEFCTIYRERTGQPLHLGEFKSMECLLKAMPDIVNFQVGRSGPDEQMVTLVQSRRNMRILSTAKAGLRQVLFWILLKNPGGIWRELLESWYLDFAGWPFSSALASHGYEKPRSAPLQPITEFLQDMVDILSVDEIDSSLYLWTGDYEDPVLRDASLLGTSTESIQYDPTNEEKDNTRWQTTMIAKATNQLKNKELEKPCSDFKTTLSSISDTTHAIEAH